MNERLSWVRLILKELKQLRPLLLTLVVCSLGFHTFFILLDHKMPHVIIPWTICCLYNAGVGAILVGQEKERGSLTWLRTLPITPMKILTSKVLAGVLGFAILAIAGMAIWWMAVRIDPPDRIHFSEWHGISEANFISYAFACLFLFSLGFALTWKIESPLLSMILMIPILVVPPLGCALVIDYVRRKDSSFYIDRYEYFYSWAFALSALAASVFTWRFGLAYLNPTRPPRSKSSPVSASQVFYRPEKTQSLVAPPRLPALMWQHAKQNRWLLVALALVGTLPAMLSALLLSPEETAIVFEILCGGLAVTWLGVLTFGSDLQKNRIRFLASMGVSPGKVWWTRQLSPAVVLILGSIVVGFCIAIVGQQNDVDTIDTSNFFDLLLAIIAVYAIAQWTGQIVRSPIIALVLVPLIVGLCAAAFYAATVLLGAPYWSRWFAVTIPFIATRLGMKSWMDGRTGWKYWGLQTSLLFLPFVLACSPIARTYFKYPPIDRRTFDELKRRAAEYPFGNQPPQTVEFPRFSRPTEGEKPAPAKLPYADVEKSVDGRLTPSRREQIENAIAEVESRLSSVTGPIREKSGCMEFLQSCAVVARLRLESDEHPEREATSEQYRRVIKLLLLMQMGLRKNSRLFEQEQADRLEAWMLREAERDKAERDLGDRLLSELGSVFRNAELRNQHRRWAIAMSWQANRTDGNRSILGGMDISVPAIQGTLNSSLAVNHRADTVCATLLDCVNEEDEARRREKLALLARLYGYSAPPSDNAPGFLLTSLNSPYPGYLWFGDWEKRAARFSMREVEEK